jgi:hypothetical protein
MRLLSFLIHKDSTDASLENKLIKVIDSISDTPWLIPEMV